MQGQEMLHWGASVIGHHGMASMVSAVKACFITPEGHILANVHIMADANQIKPALG